MSDIDNHSPIGLLIGNSELRYSYNQFLVFDANEVVPGCHWEDAHWRQGFARRDCIIAFATLDQAGIAHLLIRDESDVPGSKIRIIESYIKVPSGKICIEGVDEYPISRYVLLRPGIYKVKVSQEYDNNNNLIISIMLNHCEEALQSKIILADSVLQPPSVLRENSDFP